MPNVVIAGAQWGDEGKGKIVDLLTAKVQVVARYNGGHNAGHTVIVGTEKFVLHLIPSGILHTGILNVMGPGMVIDPWALEAEMAELREKGVAIEGNLLISDRAHLILPHHRSLETLSEEGRGARKIGTTRRGIGPAYEDKAGRRGLRMGDLLRPAQPGGEARGGPAPLRDHLPGHGRTPGGGLGRLVDDLTAFGDRLRPRIGDAALGHRPRDGRNGYSVLFEGAQATLLDIDHGTYPFVTSSSACAAELPSGSACRRRASTASSASPRPTPPASVPVRSRARSVESSKRRSARRGTSTVPPPAGPDAAAGSTPSSCAMRPSSTASTRWPSPSSTSSTTFPRSRSARATAWGTTCSTRCPGDLSILESCEPVYEVLPGWKTRTAGTRSFGALPDAAKRYLDRLSELCGVQVGIVSTSPDRDDTILRSTSPAAAWFA